MQCTGHSGRQMAGSVATTAVRFIGGVINLITSFEIYCYVVPFSTQS